MALVYLAWYWALLSSWQQWIETERTGKWSTLRSGADVFYLPSGDNRLVEDIGSTQQLWYSRGVFTLGEIGVCAMQ